MKPVDPTPRALCAATTVPQIVRVPARKVVSLVGQGAPEDAALQQSIATLYGVAYALKFARKPTGGDFKVGALEAAWWTEDPAIPVILVPRKRWRWKVRLGVPADVTARALKAVVKAVTAKKSGKLFASPLAPKVQLEKVPAERVARILHVGPYAEEGRSFDLLHAALAKEGLAPGGRHLEVYLSDPRRTKPARLKTVLLQRAT